MIPDATLKLAIAFPRSGEKSCRQLQQFVLHGVEDVASDGRLEDELEGFEAGRDADVGLDQGTHRT